VCGPPTIRVSLYDLMRDQNMLAICLDSSNSCGLDLTSMEMAGGVISRLPTGGDYPFQPKKGQRLKNPKSITREDGDPIDKHGDRWEWDPVKGEWDVNHPDGSHTNVGVDGNITHGKNRTGRKPAGGDSAQFSLPVLSLTTEQRDALITGGAAGAAVVALFLVLAAA